MQKTQETWVPQSGKSPGGGNGYPLQCSCLENSMDRGASWATIHGIRRSQTWLSDWARTMLRYLGAGRPRRDCPFEDELIPEITNSPPWEYAFHVKTNTSKAISWAHHPQPCLLSSSEHSYTSGYYRDTRFYCTSHILLFFFLNKWKPCDKPVLRKSVGTIFPAVLFFN